MLTPILAMMLAVSACHAEEQGNETDKTPVEETGDDAFEGGEEFSFLESVKLVTPSGTVSGEIDEDLNVVTFRHLPDGNNIKNAIISMVDRAELVTSIDKYKGNWPKEVKIVIRKDGDKSSYRLELPDYVDDKDEFRPDEAKWSLEWSDEFNTEEIDWSVWEYVPRQDTDWANKMSPREDLTFLKDGNLELWAKVNDNPLDQSEFMTGGIWGEGLKAFKLGRVDVRARLDHGESFWPAIWMMGQTDEVGWPSCGEIDIMEHLNYDPIVYQTVHSYYTENISKDNPVDHSISRVDVRNYHIYSVEVYKDRLVYLVDNEPQLVYPKDASKDSQFPFTEYDFYVILSAQLGGQWPGEASGKNLPAAMYVDFVRYYTPRGE